MSSSPDASLLLDQPRQRCKRIVRRSLAGLLGGDVALGGFELALVLVVVAVETEQFPVAAVGRVVVVIVVAVVYGQLVYVFARELPRATAANPRVDL